MDSNEKHIVIFATRFEARKFEPPPSVKTVFSGIGKKRAKKCIEKLLNKDRPHCIINAGFAGGLNPTLPTGTIVYKTTEKDASFFDDSGAIRAKFFCSDTVVTSAEEKSELYHKTGADVVDMESEIIFKACYEKKIPCYIIRVISDDANYAMPVNFNKPLEILRGITKLLFVPGYMGRIDEFNRNMYEAAKILAKYLERFLQHHIQNQK